MPAGNPMSKYGRNSGGRPAPREGNPLAPHARPEAPPTVRGNSMSQYGRPDSPATGQGNPMAAHGRPAPAPARPAAGPPRPKTRAERWAESSTAQQTRGRVGHLRGAIQTNKDQLAEQRRLAATGSPDERRKARMAQGPIIDRIKGQAAQREKEIARARKMGWTDEDLKPRSGRGSTPQAPGVAGGSGSGSRPAASGGGSSVGGGSGKGGAKSTRGVAPRKRDYTVDAKNAKSNTVLGKALKMYGDPRRGPDKTGEMVQGGAKSPHHVTLTGKEFQSFKKKYLATHEGAGGKNLSDWSLRAMAKMLKYKNSDTVRKTYGLGEHKPPSGS